MNATYTDEITSIISILRNKIYNSDEFLECTNNKLQSEMYNPIFSYEPSGGLNIIITIHDLSVDNIGEYARQIRSIIYSTIIASEHNSYFTITKDILINIVNIIYAGTNTLVVKL